ncbi:MAG: signal peptidase I [Actinomycetota bacterium]
MTKKNLLKEFVSYLVVIVAAVAFSLIIRIFIFEPYIVPTPSMEDVLLIEDKVIVNKLAYRFGSVEREDLVVFHSPTESGKELVKRAIGLPGDEITLTNEGRIYVNGELLDEGYVTANSEIIYENKTVVLSSDEYFVMGDNRNNSLDSRYFGPIREKDIFGKLVFIYWPPQRIKRL